MVPLRALFGISVVLSFAVWGVVAALYVWPALRDLPLVRALRPMGAAYFIPTILVPLLLVTHVLVFRLLLRGESRAVAGDSQALG